LADTSGRKHPRTTSRGSTDAVQYRHRNPVVDELADRPRADASRVEDLIAHRIEDGADALEDGAVAAHHHRQIAGGGSRDSAADRRIEQVDTQRPEPRFKLPDERGTARGEIDVDLSATKGALEAVGPRRHKLDLGGAGQ